MGLRDRLYKKVGEVIGGGRGGAARPSGGLPAAPDADGFQAVLTSDALRMGQPRTVGVGGATVAVFRAEGGVYAIDNACVHEDGPLGEGTQAGLVITCPYHDWRYDIRTGQCLSEPTRRVACYAVKESGGYIWVGRKTAEGSGDRGGEHDDGLRVR